MFTMPTKKERRADYRKRISDLKISLNHSISSLTSAKDGLTSDKAELLRNPNAIDSKGVELTFWVKYRTESVIPKHLGEIEEMKLRMKELRNQLAECR